MTRLGLTLLVLLVLSWGGLGHSEPPVFNPNGAGIYRKKGGNNNTNDPAPVDCKAEEQSLMDQGKALAELNHDLGENNPKLHKLFKEEMERLRERWNALRGQCPDIKGDFPFITTDGVPADPTGGKPDPREAIDPDPLGNAIISALGDAGVGAIKGGIEGLVEIVGDSLAGNGASFTAGLATVGASAGGKAIEEGLEGAAIDQLVDKAIDEYDEGKAIYSGEGEQHTESYSTRKELVNIRDNQFRSLAAYAKGFTGYRAALAAGDAGAMDAHLRQALAAATALKKDSRAVSKATFEVDKRAQAATDQTIGAMQKKGIRWQDPYTQWQQGVKENGLPPKLVSRLKSAGVSDERVEQLRQQIVSTSPARVEAAFQARRDRLAMNQAVRDKLAAKGSNATWPEPAEMKQVEGLEQRARALQREVSHTRIDLSPPAGDEPSKLPKWWAVPSGAPVGMSLSERSLRQSPASGPLMPGTYDVYLSEPIGNDEHQVPPAVRVAKAVKVERGKPTEIPLRTGLQLKVPDGVAPPRSWFVLPSNAASTTPLAGKERSLDPLLLPPGQYDVYWVHSDDQMGKPLLVAHDMKVAPNQMATLTVPMSSATIEVAEWVPPHDPNRGWWGLTRAGDPSDAVIHAKGLETSISVPAGHYDVYWKQDYEHRPMLLEKGIELKAGAKRPIAAATGILLETAPWVPARDEKHGRWGVTLSGQTPREFLNDSNKDDKLLLPPGRYDVYWVQAYGHEPFMLARSVDVRSGAPVTVKATTGLRLKVPGGTTIDAQHGFWGVVKCGRDPREPSVRSKGLDQPLLVPPGTYDVVWKQNYEEPSVVVKQGVVVPGAGVSPVEVEIQPPPRTVK